MPKGKSRHLFNQSKKDITMVEIVESDMVVSITVEQDTFFLNQTWENDKLLYEQEGTDEDQYFKVELARDNSDKSNPKFFGQIALGAATYQIITSTGISYKLYKSNVERADGENVDDLQYTYWKTLSVTIQRNLDHTLATSFALDGVEANAILYNDALSCSYSNDNEELIRFSLDFSLLSDSLTGYWNKKQKFEEAIVKNYYFKADICGSFKPVQDFTAPDSTLTLKELLSLSIYTVEDNVVVDNASKHAAKGFDTLVRYCMSDTNRKSLLGDQQPQLSVDLQDILKKKGKGFRDAKDFYKEYSVYWLAKALHTNPDDSLKKVDYLRVDNYLNSGVLQDYNYVVQTNLLYKYGYKKAMPRIVDYIQDAAYKNKTYWAEQLFLYFSQDQKLSEMALLLMSPNENDVVKAKDTISTIMYKMNILDESMKFSKELFSKIQSAMYQEANLEWMKKLTEDEEEIMRHANLYQDEMNHFVDMIKETAKKLQDKLLKDFLFEVSRECTSNLRLALELYMIGNRINLHESISPAKFVEDISQRSTSLGGVLKNKMFGSKTKFAMFAIGMISNMASMFFMTMNFQQLDKSEKAQLIATWAFVGVSSLTMCIGRSVQVYKEWKTNKKNKADLEALTEDQRTAAYNQLRSKGAARMKDEGFLKNTKKSLKTFDGICRVIGIIGSAINLGFSIKALIDACKAGDSFNIGLDAGMLITQTIETISMFLAIGLKNGAALANALIGDFASFVSLIIMFMSVFQKQETTIEHFVKSGDMDYLRFHDMSEIETYNEFTQREGDSKSSTSELVNGSYKLSLKPQKLVVVHTATKQETIIANFDNPQSSSVKIVCDLEKLKCQNVDDSTLLAVLDLGQQMNFVDLPMYLKLSNDGKVVIRTKDGSKEFPVNSETFKLVKK